MRKVTEKTFKTYARDAVKELNTLELTAELEITALSAEITLLRDTKEVGHISITADGWVYAKDFTRDEVFNIVPEHDTMKDLFSQIYPTVNGLLDNDWFWIETAEPQEAEQVEEVAEEPKKYFAVTFEKNGIYSANIAHAVKKSDVEAHYSKYNNCVIEEAKGYKVEEAKRKHMPIVEIEPVKEEAEKPEGRTITVTLHPEDEEEEKTITYAGVKTYGFVAGKTAKMIESHTDGSCIDKNHEYLVVVFRDLTETVFRRSSVVEVKEGNRIMVNGWDEDEPTADAKTAAAEEPQPTPEEADREVTYIDFKPEQDYSEEEQKEISETAAGVGLELLEEQLTELEKLEEESDKADDAWDKDPLNAELEAASDKAYEKEWKQYMDTVKTLAKLINTDTKTARQMLQRGSRNREKVWNYLKRRKIYESK